MRLLIMTPWPLGTPGGAQALVRGLAGALARDFEMEVSVATGAEPPSGPPLPCGTAAVSGVRMLPLALRFEPRPSWLPPESRVVGACWLEGLEEQMAREAPDALLYTPHNSSCAHQAAHAAERLSVPFLLWPLIHLDQARHTNTTARRLYRSASLVVATSEAEQRWLLNRARVPAARTLLLGCGYEPAAEAAGFQDVAEGSTKPLRLLTIGEFRPHKRLEDQIEALAILRQRMQREVRLTLAGAARDRSVLDRLEALARRRNVEGEVSFLANPTDSTIAGLHALSDVFLFTSASESFGLALLEAIGFGTLPVVYPHPVYRDIVGSAGFGAVAKRASPAALAEAIASALSRPSRDEPRRREWLETRRWSRVAAPLVERLIQIVESGSRRNGRLDPPSSENLCQSHL